MDLKSLVLAGVPQADFTLTDGRKIRLRSFLVKELKLLMLAKEGGSEDKMIAQVLQQCVMTDNVDIEMIPSFDIERMFLQLFVLSKGSKFSDVAFVCQNEVDGHVCGTRIKTRVNLETVKLDKDVNKDNLIKVNDSMVLEMRFPALIEREYFGLVKEKNDEMKKIIDLCLNCVSSINANGQKLVVGQDISKEELSELMDLMDGSSFEKIIKFLESVPTMHIHLPLKCPKCGYEDTVELRGIADFFD